jgi:ribose 5-phosphate isomerase B
MKKIAIGSDPNAYELKKHIMDMLDEGGYMYQDFGSSDIIYANVAIKVAEAVSKGSFERGILICGTGIGMCIAANKVKGAYAAPGSNIYGAERASLSNNANILTLGAQVIGPILAERLVAIWLENDYVPNARSDPKIRRITEYEKGQINQE